LAVSVYCGRLAERQRKTIAVNLPSTQAYYTSDILSSKTNSIRRMNKKLSCRRETVRRFILFRNVVVHKSHKMVTTKCRVLSLYIQYANLCIVDQNTMFWVYMYACMFLFRVSFT